MLGDANNAEEAGSRWPIAHFCCDDDVLQKQAAKSFIFAYFKYCSIYINNLPIHLAIKYIKVTRNEVDRSGFWFSLRYLFIAFFFIVK